MLGENEKNTLWTSTAVVKSLALVLGPQVGTAGVAGGGQGSHSKTQTVHTRDVSTWQVGARGSRVQEVKATWPI